ncbi:MAG: c-type cytochrome biogenesis protein CcmI [Pseudomonadota bacterium]|nr:c-type cytochrome biogenesis protein CcmI [Pseudomonadota bacterium]
MIAFAVVAITMIAIAVAWVLVPLIRHHRSAGLEQVASNVAILRDQLRELDADAAAGRITPADYEEARRELEQRVLDEAQPDPAIAPPKPARFASATVWSVAAVLPVAALALYAAWGNLDALSPAAKIEPPQREVTPGQVNEMVAKLAKRLETEPNNTEGWLILARSYQALNRFAESSRAFEHVLKFVPNDPNVLVDYADALAASQQSLQGKPTDLVAQALQIDPTHLKGLALAGSAAFDRNDYKQAVSYWEALRKRVPADSPLVPSIDQSIVEARQLAGIAAPGGGGASQGTARDRPSGDLASANGPSSGSSAAASGKVEGVVTLSPAIAANASPNDTVFIFARAADGPRMPVAVLKRRVRDLPVRFTLDDSTAMSPDVKLSSFAKLIVGARVSKTGSAMPASGDLEGYSPAIAPGTLDVNIVIDRAIP